MNVTSTEKIKDRLADDLPTFLRSMAQILLQDAYLRNLADYPDIKVNGSVISGAGKDEPGFSDILGVLQDTWSPRALHQWRQLKDFSEWILEQDAPDGWSEVGYLTEKWNEHVEVRKRK